jgi:hypothetical protein
MIDKTGKLLLALIAAGLWANIGVSLLRPAAAIAEGYELESLKSNVSDLTRIGRGTCTNTKIC